jgi:hypothetical protein
VKLKQTAAVWEFVMAATLVAIALLISACRAPATTPPIYSSYELEYRLIANFGDVFWCDPDFYPIGRPGQEEQNALEQYPTIRANSTEFAAIQAYLSLPTKADYTAEEKLLIYRQHKKLTYAVEITASGDVYNFSLRVGEGQGERIEGTITPSGEINVLNREPSFNTCPICLTKGTLIDTPNGAVPVEQLHEGMAVWSVDDSGKRIAATIVETAIGSSPSSFRAVKITLSDGRAVTTSPGHPTADGRALGDYQVGDTLDGGVVVAVELVDYGSESTYDLLPSGTTGLYWANGIILKNTLVAN